MISLYNQTKKHTKLQIAILCLGMVIFQSCSSVKVLDSWKDDNLADIKNNRFLVVARSHNAQARIAFENEIVAQMKAKGYDAIASYKKFGSLKPSDQESDENKEKLKQVLKQEGFNAIVLTVMKDYKEETRVQKEGGYYAGGNYYGYYPRYYGGFYGYYYHPLSYQTLGNYVEESYTTTTSKIYILETTVYNLEKSSENQLVAVITSQIDNPNSATSAATEYVKEIAKRFK